MGFQRRSSDAGLVERVRAGDMASYDELYRRHLDETRRLARLITWSGDEADDIAAEAFTRVLARLQDGAGPDGDFVPYLRTVVRRLAIERHRGVQRDAAAPGPDVLENLPGPDDKVEIAATRTMVRQAYETLPPRWQQVLWHLEIEGETPAALATTFDSTPNAVAALAYRAREGLRRAYLGLHLAGSAREVCKPFLHKLSALSRGGLDVDERLAVRAHLGECTACRQRYEEMLLLVSDLRGVLAPALLGVAAQAHAAVGTAAGATGAAMVPAGSAAADGAGPAPRSSRRHDPRSSRASLRSGVMVGTLIAATVAVLAFAIVVANLGSPSDDVAAPPPAPTGTPEDQPARVSLETATPRPTESATTDTSESATTDTPPTAESTPGSDPEPDPESNSEPAPEPGAAADGSSATTEDAADQRETPGAASSTPKSTPTPTTTPASATPAASPPPAPDASEAVLQATRDGADAPNWWCEEVPWWPGCDGSDRESPGDGESWEDREDGEDWFSYDGWFSLRDLESWSPDELCELLGGLEPCSDRWDRHRHGD